MASEPTGYRLTWGSETLPFETLDDLMAFAREQGCNEVTYRPFWHTHADGVTL